MNRDPRLERYLSTLESALKPFPVSDRAEIITEIKSHVYAALERDPQATIDGILAALGEPEIVANRYLLERGMKPAKPPISPIVRWMVIGFLGTFAMVLLFSAFVIAQFSPIVKVDEKTNKVEVLGGMIKIDGDNENISIRGVFDIDGHQFAGAQSLKDGDTIDVKFSNGRVDVETNDESSLSWECKGGGSSQSPTPTSTDGMMSLDLTPLKGVRCDLSVPKNAKLKLAGGNGKISVNAAAFDAKLELDRGHVAFGAADGIDFQYDVKVDMGRTDSFQSASSPGAHLAKIHVGSGRISNEN